MVFKNISSLPELLLDARPDCEPLLLVGLRIPELGLVSFSAEGGGLAGVLASFVLGDLAPK